MSIALGPILRHIGETDATVWVEASAACEVEVLGRSSPTFCVEGRHYAIIPIEGLEPGASYLYEVHVDGERAWPPAESGLPPSAIRTIDPNRPVRLAFGSCRTAAPHEPPYTERRASKPNGFGIDALRTLALRLAGSDPQSWPQGLLMLGDQIYADQPSVRISDFVREHQVDPDAPPNQLEDFTEYAYAYCDAWGEPYIRWLLSVVPTTMIFDDHEIHDEWRISQSWLEEMRSQEWYERRVTGGLMAYWLYQHLGNLSPAELRDDELLARVRSAEEGGPILREFARDSDRQPGHSRWSFCRDFGRSRLVVIDSRAGRELTPGRRRMISPGEWRWVEERARGEYEHLLLASSVPFLLTPALHDLEASVERVCDGAWGRLASRAGERLRRRGNLDHWAAYQDSFAELAELLESVAAPNDGPRPGSVLMLSGDVHHCYLAEAWFGDPDRRHAPVWQVVCSGFRKRLDPRERAAIGVGYSGAGRLAGSLLARATRAPRHRLEWAIRDGPSYENQIGTLTLEGRSATVGIESTIWAGWRHPRLDTVFERRLC